MLKKKPSERLGHGGAAQVKQHPFFSGINWSQVERKEYRPLFVPDNTRANFSAIFEAEDVLMEDYPLMQSSKKSRGPPKTETHRYIEENFRDFDFKKREIDLQIAQADLVKKSMAREQELISSGTQENTLTIDEASRPDEHDRQSIDRNVSDSDLSQPGL